MTGAGGNRPHLRIADAIRRDIVYGHLPPGARIPHRQYAKRYHTGPYTAHRAVRVLQQEELVYCPSYTNYAAPAGPPDPAVAARLGATLARLRETAGRGPDDLAAAGWDARHVTAAENGTWQPRDFWQAMDTSLGADGTLLKIHDNYYAGPAPAAPDPGPPDPSPLPGIPWDTATEAATAQIAARLTAGEWAPGTALPTQQRLAEEHATYQSVISHALRELASQGHLTPVPLGGSRYAYLIPSPACPATAPTAVRTPVAIIVVWSDGIRTRHPLHPATPQEADEGEEKPA